MSFKLFLPNKILKQQAEKIRALKETIVDFENYINDLHNFVPVPWCSVNPADVITEVNVSFSELTGYIDLDIYGEKVSLIFNSTQQAKNLKEEIAKSEKVKNYEIEIVTKNKHIIPVLIFAMKRKDKDGNYVGYFFIIFRH